MSLRTAFRHAGRAAVASGVLAGAVLAMGIAPANAASTPSRAPAVAALSPGDHAYCDNYVYRQGSRGACVELIQFYLYQYGFGRYLDGHGGIDGVFGSATYQAVRAFQSKYNLKVDGVVGSQTWYWFGYLA